MRNDLIVKHITDMPTTQNYQVMKDGRSLYNTPFMLAIYVANLCIKRRLDQGGLKAMDAISEQKSRLVYQTIDYSTVFYIRLSKQDECAVR